MYFAQLDPGFAGKSNQHLTIGKHRNRFASRSLSCSNLFTLLETIHGMHNWSLTNPCKINLMQLRFIPRYPGRTGSNELDIKERMLRHSFKCSAVFGTAFETAIWQPIFGVAYGPPPVSQRIREWRGFPPPVPAVPLALSLSFSNVRHCCKAVNKRHSGRRSGLRHTVPLWRFTFARFGTSQ